MSDEIDLAAIAIRKPRTPRSRAGRKVQARVALVKKRKERREELRRVREGRKLRRARSTWGKFILQHYRAEARKTWTPERGGDPSLFPHPLWRRVLCAMHPGAWYTTREIIELTGGHPGSVGLLLGCHGRKRPRLTGLVEKGRVKGARERCGRSGPIEARFVWRLTEAGVRARELQLMLE